jgi:diguanylate cyclase (GGDEF)-like protein
MQNQNQPHVPPLAPVTLVVEDDPDQRQLICESMRMYFDDPDGRRIQAVGTGRECLQRDLAAMDIILLDFNLPDMSGLDLLSKVTTLTEAPVIFVTGENIAATAAQAIRNGAQDYVVKLGDYLFALPVVVEKNIRQHRMKLENARLQTQLQASLEEIRVKNLQLEESLARMKQMASTDHLTGLTNRRVLADILERSFQEARRYNFDLTCMMLDLDGFKRLNDTRGHQLGDRILVAAADVIRANLRSSDAAARFGGDEFVLLLPHTSVDMARKVGNRIRNDLLTATRPMLAGNILVSFSVGIASLRSHSPADSDALLSMADKALYAAKAKGKDCVVEFTPEDKILV